MKVEINYGGLNVLLVLYAKLKDADFGSTKRALTHIKDAKKIEAEQAVSEEFVKNFMSKHSLSQGDMIQGDAFKEYSEFVDTKVELELESIDFSVIEQANLSPIQLLMLEELGIITIPE